MECPVLLNKHAWIDQEDPKDRRKPARVAIIKSKQKKQ